MEDLEIVVSLLIGLTLLTLVTWLIGFASRFREHTQLSEFGLKILPVKHKGEDAYVVVRDIELLMWRPRGSDTAETEWLRLALSPPERSLFTAWRHLNTLLERKGK